MRHLQRLTMIVLAAIASGIAGCGPRSRLPDLRGMPSRESPIRFSDVTASAGITWKRGNGAYGARLFPETMGGGGAFVDYDHDGWPDIILVNGDAWPGHRPPDRALTLALYRNNGNGTFTDVTSLAGLDKPMQGMGVAVGDYDGDGFDDLYITGVGANRLYHNDAGRRFTDVTTASGTGGSGWSTSACWLDYDNDGKPDLFVCHYVRWTIDLDQFCGSKHKIYCTPTYYAGESCRLYHNLGGGRFRDVTRQAGMLNDCTKALGVCAVDVDHDGFTDLIVANDQEPNVLYRNNHDGTFTDTALEFGLGMGDDGRPRSGMGIDAADCMNDRALCVLVGNFSTQGASLFRESDKGLYSDRARESGLRTGTLHFVTFGCLFCDLDNDGWKDIVLANGHVDDTVEETSSDEHYLQPPAIFWNQQSGTFTNVSGSAGREAMLPMAARGLCTADYDGDGKLDLLLIPALGPPRLLHNNSNSGKHWIQLDLRPKTGNTDAFGAIAEVRCGNTTQSDYVRSGGSYLAQSAHRLHFGLGASTTIDELTVVWPGGHRDHWTNVKADSTLAVAEGEKPKSLSPAPKPERQAGSSGESMRIPQASGA